jgi:hypothetical protein
VHQKRKLFPGPVQQFNNMQQRSVAAWRVMSSALAMPDCFAHQMPRWHVQFKWRWWQVWHVAQVPLQVGVQYRVRRWKVKCWVVDDNRLTQQFIRQLTRQERPFRVFKQTFRTELLVRTSSKKSSTQNLTQLNSRTSPIVLPKFYPPHFSKRACVSRIGCGSRWLDPV